MMSIFMDEPNGEAMTVGVQFLKIVAPFYFIASTKLVCDGILRGAGMMKQFMAATFTDLILRVVLAQVLAINLGMGVTGIWSSWPIGWCVGAVFSLIFYRSGVWNKKQATLNA